jgi:hypothetical protein
MRSLLLSLMIIGLSFVNTAPALADDVVQSHNVTTNTAYLNATSDQTAVIPVARYYSYYGGPNWYAGRVYPRYRNYYYNYPARPYPYRTYVVPGSVYGYSSYAPYDFYYSGPRVRFGFGF